jgi:hypothetical protein
MIIVGRVIQRMGAVSSEVIAFIADLTAEEHRTKAMANGLCEFQERQ